MHYFLKKLYYFLTLFLTTVQMHPKQSQNLLHEALNFYLFIFSKWQMSQDVDYDNIFALHLK